MFHQLLKKKIKAKNSLFLWFFTLFFAIFIGNFAFLLKINNNELGVGWCYSEELSSAKSMVVIEKTSNRILYSKNQNERLPMASLTKIITAIYVIEHCEDLDSIFEIPSNAVGIEGTSIGLKEGEHLSVRELLYGLMLRSGNDAAVALSILMSGSESEFVKEVNEWLLNLGLKDTHLKNTHGLHHDEHYTTAFELAKITAYALNNSIFQEIVSCKNKKISNELNSKTSRNLINKNKYLKNYEYADGVKTGFTNKAGRCFVGSATKNNMQVICVLLNCVPMFEECEKLITKAFEEYELTKVLTKGCFVGSAQVLKSELNLIDVFVSKDYFYPLKKDEIKEIKFKFKQKDGLIAPINVGQEIGSVEISLKNQLIFTDKIYNINYIKSIAHDSEFKRIVKKM